MLVSPEASACDSSKRERDARLNKIWFALLLIGILYGFGKGTWNSYQQAAGPVVPDEQQPVKGVTSEADARLEGKENSGDDQRDHRTLQEEGRDLNAAALDAANCRSRSALA